MQLPPGMWVASSPRSTGVWLSRKLAVEVQKRDLTSIVGRRISRAGGHPRPPTSTTDGSGVAQRVAGVPHRVVARETSQESTGTATSSDPQPRMLLAPPWWTWPSLPARAAPTMLNCGSCAAASPPSFVMHGKAAHPLGSHGCAVEYVGDAMSFPPKHWNPARGSGALIRGNPARRPTSGGRSLRSDQHLMRAARGQTPPRSSPLYLGSRGSFPSTTPRSSHGLPTWNVLEGVLRISSSFVHKIRKNTKGSG